MTSQYLKIGDELNDSQKLWRYMDLSKFISLIEKKLITGVIYGPPRIARKI